MQSRLRFTLLLLLSSVGVAGAGCSCRPPPVQLEDGGMLLVPECSVEADCALGEVCSDGRCQLPVNGGLDGATGCTTDEQCPMGERCLRSAGLCVPDQTDAGTEPIDSGVVGDCLEGETQSCGSSKLGECRLGVQTCVVIDGVPRFGACVGAVDAVSELCNGLDDDCDGQVDDGFTTQSCGVGECARTIDTCVGGVSLTCTPGTASTEVCDGRDNDCNGQTDDGLANLVCGVGACARSVVACFNGMPQSCTPGMPTAELCNGADDDCDGTPDEGLGQTSCGLGQCSRTVDACTNGMATACVPGQPQAEACNMVDDDCDGLIDETCACTTGQTQGCYTGAPGTQGVGTCRAGSQSCVAGQWAACTGQVVGATETCNGLDDDCDGQADESLGQTMCGVGACVRTVQNCQGGAAQSCTAGTPGTESCNGLDDDCDGVVDDGLGTLTCGVGACVNSIAACANGATQTCSPGPTSTEVCNAIDDDCDGQTDETFPQQGTSCATGRPGLCATGASQCVSGAVSCQQTVMPAAEVCNNGLDENCNGTVDDPMACGCNAAIDRDFDGANECVDCNDGDGTIRPGAMETCNGKDDDCDMLRDEGFDLDSDGFTTCGTVATGGVDPLRRDCNDANAFIFPLKTADCGNMATPNTANGVDDNCNGYPDETCSCTTNDRDGDGVTQCAGDCNDNDATISPNRAEVCDGKDNDCNRNTVDNCGVSERCGVKQGNSWTRWAAGTDQCRPDLICTSNVSTGELTCGSFCNQTTGGGLNDSCQANEGCFRNLIDSANLHLCSVLTIGTKTTGQACTAPSECRSGDCVLDGAARYCTDKCTHESGCSGPTTCTVRKDPLTSGPFTIGNYFWSACRLDSLITAVKTTGQTCTGAECRAGPDACFNGRCIEPCCANSDCAGGSSCTIAGPKSATGYTSGTSSIVSVLPACVPSAAVRVSGAACTANSECRSGLCEKTRNICVDVCCSDASCPNGTTCEPVSLKLNTGELTTMRGCVFAPVPTLLEQK
ncbi:MAG: putative metal-binding motif-containing protein [Archangium sp.]|nr:putative metal-binding motif-containing protein [Archangium sp.]MDP3575906.1 putative metal-binding motif-containing protein [Archangium sp.]